MIKNIIALRIIVYILFFSGMDIARKKSCRLEIRLKAMEDVVK
jgi:hypothetical protein